MEPIHYLRALRRRWWVIASSVVVAVSVALAASVFTPAPAAHPAPSTGFTASKVLWDPGAPIIGPGSPVTNPVTLAGLVMLPNVSVIAAEKMHYQGDPFDLSSQVRASGNSSNGFLTIIGTGKDPQTAQAVADAFSQALVTYLARLKNAQIDQQEELVRKQIAQLLRRGVSSSSISTLQSGLAQLEINRTTPISLTEIPGIQQSSLPAPPHAVVAPSKGFKAPKSLPLRILFTALFGLLAGIALALVLERFDTRIRTARSAEEAFGLPVLAEIPAIPRNRRSRVVTATHPSSPPADAFRLLGAATSGWDPPPIPVANGKPSPRKNAKAILVASPEPRDGRTTVAANLAVAHAQAGRRVLVVSADLRQPAIHRVFRTADRPGLTDLLEMIDAGPDRDAPVDLALYLEPCSVLRVGVLPGGSPSGRPAELLGSVGMHSLLERLKTGTDVVILDCASLGVASDVAPLLSQVDGVVLVARAGKTRRELAASTSAFLERSGVTRAGVVLNDTREFSIPPAKRRLRRPTIRRAAGRGRSSVLEPWSSEPAERHTTAEVSQATTTPSSRGRDTRASTTKRTRDRALVEAAAIGRSQDPVMVPGSGSESAPRQRVTLPPPAMEELYKQLVDLGEQLEGSQSPASDPSHPHVAGEADEDHGSSSDG